MERSVVIGHAVAPAFEACQRQQVASTLDQLSWEDRARHWRDWLAGVVG